MCCSGRLLGDRLVVNVPSSSEMSSMTAPSRVAAAAMNRLRISAQTSRSAVADCSTDMLPAV